MNGRLQDKIAIITGAGAGIGEATAKKFVKEGAKVIIAEINSESGIKIADEINNNGGKAYFIETDVTSSSSVKSMVEKTVSIVGSPEILINNAGIVVFDDPLKLSDEDWKKCFSVDLDGVWYCCQHTLPYMLDKKKGSIVNIASVAGKRPLAGAADYCVSKAGVIMLTNVMATELATTNIRINAIGPGFIETPMTAGIRQSPDWMDNVMMMTPMQRFGQPNEISSTALFLASDESSYFTGQTLFANGGMFIG